MLTFPAILLTASISLMAAAGSQFFGAPKMQGFRTAFIFGLLDRQDNANSLLCLCH